MVPIRTLTLGVAEPHPLPAQVVARSAAALRRAEAACRGAGYEVQTLRLSTRPVFGDVTPTAAYARELQAMLDDAGLTYCSLGPATSGVELIPDLLVGNDALNCTVRLDGNESAALATAEAMLRLANETDEGFGNFRFAALARVPPGGPFFPAAYHDGPANLTVGLQGASIAVRAAKGGLDGPAGPAGLDAPAGPAAPGGPGDTSASNDSAGLAGRMAAALTEEATPVVALAERVAAELGVRFGGIDLSPAPNGDDSIAAAFEAVGADFGAPGTLAVAAALTAGIRGTALPVCGYNGLMLPVMEDVVIARRWEEGRVGLHDLLAYSSVCGTGLDTVPLPGDSRADDIARLLRDVTALAVRLRKPLSARLFPVPGTRSGDRTAFSSPYLTDTVVHW